MPDTIDTTLANPSVRERSPRKMHVLFPGAQGALDLWLAGESTPDPVDHFERLLPRERVGDLDEDQAFMTALALSPTCRVGEQVPHAALEFIANYDAAHPECGLAARFESRAEGDVLNFIQARAEMRKTLRYLWSTFDGWDAAPAGPRGIEDYYYDLQGEKFWYPPHMLSYSTSSINGAVGYDYWPVEQRMNASTTKMEEVRVPPSRWLKDTGNGQTVDCVAWMPGEPPLVRNTLIDETGKRRVIGRITLNTWRPGPEVQADAPPADGWLILLERMFPDYKQREEFLNRCAYIVQNPGKIVNGFMGLIGPQGVGKDAVLFPLNYALGWHNVRNVTPDDVVSTFNPWLRSQLVILNELRLDPRDGGGHELYSKMKSYFTTPPDIVMINDKNEKLRAHLKTASCIATSNDLASLPLPPGERRAFLPEIRLKENWHIEANMPDFFKNYWHWMTVERGEAAVHKYLAARDISSYDPKALPPMTRTKRQVQEVAKGGDHAIARAIEKLGRPEVFFEIELHDIAKRDCELGVFVDHDLQVALRPKNRVQLIESAGYLRFPNPDGKDWESRPTKPAVGDTSKQVWRKRSSAAYVRREVWDDVEESVVVRHLHHRLRRLALEDPRITRRAASDEKWIDPSNGKELEPLPPMLTEAETAYGMSETVEAEPELNLPGGGTRARVGA